MDDDADEADWLPQQRGGWRGQGQAKPHQSLDAPSLFQRILARLVDVVAVVVPVAAVFALVGLLVGVDEDEAAAFEFEAWVGFGTETWVGVAVLVAVYGIYTVVMEARSGATLGKRLMRLRVVGADGGACSATAAAKRNAWLLAGLVPVVGTLLVLVAAAGVILTISSGDDDRGIHDVLADTRVTTTLM